MFMFSLLYLFNYWIIMDILAFYIVCVKGEWVYALGRLNSNELKLLQAITICLDVLQTGSHVFHLEHSRSGHGYYNAYLHRMTSRVWSWKVLFGAQGGGHTGWWIPLIKYHGRNYACFDIEIQMDGNINRNTADPVKNLTAFGIQRWDVWVFYQLFYNYSL